MKKENVPVAININSIKVVKDERVVISLDKLLAALGYTETNTVLQHPLK